MEASYGGHWRPLEVIEATTEARASLLTRVHLEFTQTGGLRS